MGVLLGPNVVLSARHFLREAGGTPHPKAPEITVERARLYSSGTEGRITAREIPGSATSDLVMLRLAEPLHAPRYPSLGGALWPGAAIMMPSQKGWLKGLCIMVWPLQLARNLLTVATPSATVVHNHKAIKGDSGAPVLRGWEVVGIQSMITDPFGINLGFATTALVWPYTKRLGRILAETS